MRTRAYGAAEKAIAAADTNTIRERWLYGLRLVNDEDAIAPGGGLKQGVTDRLIETAARSGVKLSATEIRRRRLCARAYPKESQIVHAVDDFGTWRDLSAANFPAYDAAPDEPDADWRTDAERKHSAAQRLADLVGEQGVLFPYDMFEPDESTIKELQEYATEQAALTERFAERDRKRAEYLEQLLKAVDGDESATWRDAHLAAFGTDDVDETTEEGDPL